LARRKAAWPFRQVYPRQLQNSLRRFLFAGVKAVAVYFKKQDAGNKAGVCAADKLMVAENIC